MSYDKKNKLHIVSVVAVIRNGDGKYLVLKRSPREIAYPSMWTLPGGKVEADETLEEALAKELKEEVGLILKQSKYYLKDKAFVRPDGQTVKVISFLCDVEDFNQIKFDENDFTEYKWVDVSELRQLKHVGIEEELLKADELMDMGPELNKLATKSEK